MAAMKINLMKIHVLMWYRVVPTKIFQHENLSYKSFACNMKISTSTVYDACTWLHHVYTGRQVYRQRLDRIGYMCARDDVRVLNTKG